MMRCPLPWIGAVLLPAALLCGGCQSYVPSAAAAHCIVMLNEDGDACNPLLAAKTPMEPAAYRKYMQEVLDAMDDYHVHLAQAGAAHEPRKILIFIHGGLDGLDKSLRRDQKQYQAIKDAGYYPLFIDWDSGLVSSYNERLLWIRQGRKQTDALHKTLDILSSPLYLAADLGGAVVRAPVVWAQFTSRTIENSNARIRCVHDGQPFWLEHPDSLTADKFYSVLDRRYRDASPAMQPASQPLRISIGREETSAGYWYKDSAKWAAELPFKLVTTPIVDSMGRASWENMSRRTVTLFEDPREIKAVGLGRQKM